MSTLAATRPVAPGLDLETPNLEEIESEREDRESSPPQFKVLTYPADYTLEGIVTKFQRGQIKIPGFQRKFVWSKPQSAKLIESFLLGLPVPAVFLFLDSDGKTLNVIDGQQRLLSIVYFFTGTFGSLDPNSGEKFRLRGLDEHSPYRDRTYEELRDSEPEAFATLNDAVLRIYIVRQLSPEDTNSAYYIFERLNTGGTQLVGQEIRNCIYAGPFSDMLGDLNREPSWREVFGKEDSDKRQRDVELVLRFLALRENAGYYKKPMKEFLSRFMGRHRYDSATLREEFESTFRRTMNTVRKRLGPKPFHIAAGLNAAVFDAVVTAFSRHLGNIPDNIKQRYDDLVTSDEFLKHVRVGTTDEAVVAKRLRQADEALFG